MKRADKKRVSLLMTAVYLLLTLSPLASIGNQSQPLFQALTSECYGDCRLCGCSAERSAARACCCWQKKLAEAKRKQAQTACATTAAPPPRQADSDCDTHASHGHHDSEAAAPPRADNGPEKDAARVGISTCPCGSGKDLAFSVNEKAQHVPFRFASGVPLQPAAHFSFLQPERLASRYCEPPDPPPKPFTTA